ncbi:MAG: DMT family transporter [Hyphomicrobiaceae bacterium]
MATTAAVPGTESGIDPIGIGLLVAGMSLAALNGAFMKLLSTDMSEFMVVWARYFGFFAVLLPVTLFSQGRAAFTPVRPGLQILRALAIATATVAFVAGARTMAYADAIAIIYVYPFILTMLAPIFLGERVPKIAWFGVIGGFTGVLVVMRPSFANLDHSALLVLFCGFMVAIHLLFNRKLAPLANPLVTSMWGALIAMIALSTTLPVFWQTPDANQLKIMAAIAGTSALSQSMVLFAFARAPASALAPFTYMEIVSAVVIGWIIFGTMPDAISWSGMALIVASGLIVAQAPRLGAWVTKRRHPAV